MVYAWPGLARIWTDGAWSGICAAIGFALLFNLCLVCTFVWNDLIPDGYHVLLAATTSMYWVLGWVDSNRFLGNRSLLPASHRQLDLFLAARGEYLRGEWEKSEELLSRILADDPRDVEARLMLATLMRHRGRIDEAREHLRRLQRLERAGYWNMEIEREWMALRRMESEIAAEACIPVRRNDQGGEPLSKVA
jgi:tetratricopeptide (TPR) repeat protein